MTPLVLLPGMMCDARLFEPQIAALAGERAVLVPAFPDGDTMADIARQLLDDLPAGFALGGLSMGGIVAMEIIRQEPDRVSGLALLDTNPLAERDEVKARRAGQVRRVLAGELHAVIRDEMKPGYLATGSDRTDIMEVCMQMALALGPGKFCNQSRALRDRCDQTETLRIFDKPSVVLCGRDDRLCPVSRHRLMHGLLPRSKLVIVEGAGHLTTLEQPEETNGALRLWLQEVDAGQ